MWHRPTKKKLSALPGPPPVCKLARTLYAIMFAKVYASVAKWVYWPLQFLDHNQNLNQISCVQILAISVMLRVEQGRRKDWSAEGRVNC